MNRCELRRIAPGGCLSSDASFTPLVAAIVVAPAIGVAQQPSAAPAATPGFDFSGVIFGNWQIKTDSASKATLGGSSPNLFDLGRAYLTFRMPAGDNGAIRITTDVFQNTNPAQNAYYQGWVVRLEVRLPPVHGREEPNWARARVSSGDSAWCTPCSTTTRSSTGRGISSRWPTRRTDSSRRPTWVSRGSPRWANDGARVYGTVTNGGGYTNYDNPGSTGQPVTSNRFKDFGLRVTLTPFGHDSTRSSYLRNLSITPWGYIGYNGSAFQSGGAGQVGPGTNGAITERHDA